MGVLKSFCHLFQSVLFEVIAKEREKGFPTRGLSRLCILLTSVKSNMAIYPITQSNLADQYGSIVTFTGASKMVPSILAKLSPMNQLLIESDIPSFRVGLVELKPQKIFTSVYKNLTQLCLKEICLDGRLLSALPPLLPKLEDLELTDCINLHPLNDLFRSLMFMTDKTNLQGRLRRLAIRGTTTKMGNFGDMFLWTILKYMPKLRELLVTPCFQMTILGLGDVLAWKLQHQNPGKAPDLRLILPGLFVEPTVLRAIIEQQCPFLPDCFRWPMMLPLFRVANLHIQYGYSGPGEVREAPGSWDAPLMNSHEMDQWFQAFNRLNGADERAYYDDRKKFNHGFHSVSYSY